MRRSVGRTFTLVALLALLPAAARPQEAVARPGGFVIDTTRLVAWERVYEMVVHRGDSAEVIGTRRVSVAPSSLSGVATWLILETRTGAIAAAESLYVSGAFAPMRWTSRLGTAQLTFQFARDSAFGGTTGPGGRQGVIIPVPAELLVSTAMIEALLNAVPLSPEWRDSVSVMRVDHATTDVIPGELVVIGEEYVGPPAWIVALRAGGRSVLFWVDRQAGMVTRIQQLLPLHVGSMLEYRSVASTPDRTSTTTPP